MRKANHIRQAGLRLLLRPVLAQRRVLFLILAISLIESGISLAQPTLLGKVITKVSNAEPMGWLPWVLGIVILSGGIFSGILHYFIQRVAETAVLSARYDLIDHILRLSISQLDHCRTGDLVSRVSNDTTTIRNMLSEGALESVASILTLVGAIVAMFIIDPLLLTVAISVSLAAVIAVVTVTQRIERSSVRLQNSVGQLAASMDRTVRAVRTIRVANATDREAEWVKKVSNKAWMIGLELAKTISLISPISSISMQISFLAVLGMGGLRVASGILTVAELVSFIMFLFLLIMPLGQLFGTIGSIGEALGGANRIAEVLHMPIEEEYDDTDSTDIVLKEPSADSPIIEFKDACFSYQREYKNEIGGTLKDVSFHIYAGQKVAIVGPSGAGKTTILNLIARLYDLSSGSILFRGRDVNRISRTEMRRHLVYVEQGAPMISGTIRDNLTLNNPNVADREIYDVLEQLNLLKIVERTGDGLDTEVGENGILFSGGECQRFALARALLSNPDILLLDEHTSNLDDANEKRVHDIVSHRATNMTRVIVTHHLPMIVDSDLIIVLEDGRIVAHGIHETLLEKSSIYQNLMRG